MKIDQIQVGEEYAIGRYSKERIRVEGIDIIEQRMGRYSWELAKGKTRKVRRVRYVVLDADTGVITASATEKPKPFVSLATKADPERYAEAIALHEERYADFEPQPLLIEARDIVSTWQEYVELRDERNAKEERRHAAEWAVREAIASKLGVNADGISFRADGQLGITFDEEHILHIVDGDVRVVNHLTDIKRRYA